MIKVFIADDHALIREGLKNLIANESDIKLVGETSDPFEVTSLVQKLNCDVVILDISMPGKSGLDVLKEIKTLKPELNVLMMSMHPEDQFAKRALKAGASGYITKESAAEELIIAIRKAAAGRKYVSTKLAESLAFDLDKSFEKNPHELLSDREFQIFRLIASGKSTSEISNELAISTSTVSTYRARILEKMNFQTNAELIHYAIQNKLIE
jgi:DNA-binding NarL/FixJ family response regulator